MVVDDEAAARALVAAGESVVLMVDPDAAPIGQISPGPGRVAVFVGSLTDPGVRQAALAMHAELFGFRS